MRLAHPRNFRIALWGPGEVHRSTPPCMNSVHGDDASQWQGYDGDLLALHRPSAGAVDSPVTLVTFSHVARITGWKLHCARRSGMTALG